MTLGGRAFFYEFIAEFNKEGKKTNWEKLWDDPAKWTKEMLGTAASRKKDDYGLLGRLGKRFQYQIEAEWRRIDQIWYHYLPKPETWESAPYRIDVAVEHENQIGNLEFTLFKFEELSIPLKICIFYLSMQDEKAVLRKSSEIISKQISSYPGGLYLMIFGLQDPKSGIYWHAYEIDSKGNVIVLHETS